jgi:hypothetical protein
MTKKKSTKVVIVRTRDAGVHVGELISRKGGEVVLANAHRIWRWRGANTLNELSQRGTSGESGYTRISEAVPSIEVIGVCEVIPCSDAAAKDLRSPRWAP